MIWLLVIPPIAGALIGIFFEMNETRIVFNSSVPTDYPTIAKIEPKPGKVITAERIRKLSSALDSVWTDVTGRPGPMPMSAKLVALAQASAEGTGFGQGWEMVGNVGSYQCSKNQPNGTSYYDCKPHKDSRPDPNGGPNIEYVTNFRSYKDGPGFDGKSRSGFDNGVADFLRSIAVKPFPAIDQLLAGDVLGYALRQYEQHYFEGFNLSQDGRRVYGLSIAYLVGHGVPVRRAGETKETVAGRIVFYAAAMARALPEIAAALGLSDVDALVAADLVQPWRGSYQASTNKGISGLTLDERVGWGADFGVDDLGLVFEIERPRMSSGLRKDLAKL